MAGVSAQARRSPAPSRREEQSVAETPPPGARECVFRQDARPARRTHTTRVSFVCVFACVRACVRVRVCVAAGRPGECTLAFNCSGCLNISSCQCSVRLTTSSNKPALPYEVYFGLISIDSPGEVYFG